MEEMQENMSEGHLKMCWRDNRSHQSTWCFLKHGEGGWRPVCFSP